MHSESSVWNSGGTTRSNPVGPKTHIAYVQSEFQSSISKLCDVITFAMRNPAETLINAEKKN